MGIKKKVLEIDQSNVFTMNALLLQDIIRFAVDVKRTEEFKFTELGNWLLENHIHFRDEFANSHISKSYRLHSKTSFIKRRLDHLIQENVIEETGVTEAAKNKQEILLYQLTSLGFELANSIFNYDNSHKYLSIKNNQKKLLYVNSKATWNPTKSAENRFYSLFLDNVYANSDYDLFSKFAFDCLDFISRLNIFTLFFPWLDARGSGFREHIGLADLEDVSNFIINYRHIILNTLNRMDDESKSLLLFQIKLDIEDYYYSRYSTTEFELLRLKCIRHLDQIIVQTECSVCGKYSPNIVKIDELFERHFGKVDISHLFPCKNCALHGKYGLTSCRLLTPEPSHIKKVRS